MLDTIAKRNNPNKTILGTNKRPVFYTIIGIPINTIDIVAKIERLCIIIVIPSIYISQTTWNRYNL